jgi:hypothetical protein
MKLDAGLTQSISLSDLAPNGGPTVEHITTDASRDEAAPWLLALIPVGSLVVAGLLVLMLKLCVATPPVPSSIEASLDEDPDLGIPTASEVDGDPWVLRVRPAFTR